MGRDYNKETAQVNEQIKREISQHDKAMDNIDSANRTDLINKNAKIASASKMQEELERQRTEMENSFAAQALGCQDAQLKFVEAANRMHNEQKQVAKEMEQNAAEIAAQRAADAKTALLQQNFELKMQQEEQRRQRHEEAVERISDAQKWNEELRLKQHDESMKMTEKLDELQTTHKNELKEFADAQLELADKRKDAMIKHQTTLANLEAFKIQTSGRMENAKLTMGTRRLHMDSKNSIGKDITSINSSFQVISAKLGVALKIGKPDIIKAHRMVIDKIAGDIEARLGTVIGKVNRFKEQDIDELNDSRKAVCELVRDNINKLMGLFPEVRMLVEEIDAEQMNTLKSTLVELKSEVDILRNNWNTMPDISNDNLVFDIFMDSTNKLMTCDFKVVKVVDQPMMAVEQGVEEVKESQLAVEGASEEAEVVTEEVRVAETVEQ